ALPVRYGSNPFDMVMYGPGGEMVRRHRTVRVPSSRLPGRHLEYTAGAGACQLDACTAVFSTGGRYGITNRLTVQGGQDLFWLDGTQRLWQPYASVTAAVLPALSLTFEGVVHGLAAAHAELEPTPDLRAELSHTIFDPAGATLSGSLFETHRTEG